MNIKITLQNSIAFLALTFVMHEAHEIVHTSIGRLICGCWGQRDFNVWDLCEGCLEAHPIALVATFAGPIFTFIMIWIGAIMLGRESNRKRVIGFTLVFANMPFARLFTAALGGGDEVFGLSQIIDNYNLAWAIGFITIFAITIYPLIKAFQSIEVNKTRWFLIFFIMPMVIDIVVVLIGLNSLLNMGVLSETWILGSPLLVTLWTIVVSVTLVLTYKYLYILDRNVVLDH